MKHDVVIVSVPPLQGNYLPAAPAILKGCCQYLRISSITIDLNLDFLEQCRQENIRFQERLAGISEDTISDQALQNITDKLIEIWAVRILAQCPKIVAVSVFSWYSQYFAKHLSKAIKRLDENCQIIMGGSGIKESLNAAPSFAENLKKKKYIDLYIDGDGEIPWYNFLVDFFKLNCGPLDVSSLNFPWIPDYSDYQIARYKSFLKDSTSQLYVPVTGSRGCVRRCDFCEIHQHWQFIQRSAVHIIEEMKSILNLTPKPHFHFTDSLINGNLKEFDLLIDKLTILRASHNFSWGGQFIIRGQSQFSEDRWRRLADSGVRNLEIGIESGSEELRYKMEKPFTNADLDFSMEMMSKYHITCVFLIIIGHPAESDSDFDKTIAMMEKYRPYQHIITAVQLGHAVAIQPGTPLYDNRKQLGIIVGKNPTIWLSAANSELTYSKRRDRRIYASNVVKKLGYTLSVSEHGALAEMEHNENKFQQEIEVVKHAMSRMVKN